jgi:hypothetical protein
MRISMALTAAKAFAPPRRRAAAPPRRRAAAPPRRLQHNR